MFHILNKWSNSFAKRHQLHQSHWFLYWFFAAYTAAVSRNAFNGPYNFQKLPFPLEIWTPSTTWFLVPTWVIHANCISIGSAIFVGLMNVTNRQTHRHTQRPRYSVCRNRLHLAIVAMWRNIDKRFEVLYTRMFLWCHFRVFLIPFVKKAYFDTFIIWCLLVIM